MKIIIFIIILISLVVVLVNLRTYDKTHSKSDKEINQDPCSDSLSDKEYLEHMIPHHQVAVDISIMLQQQTTRPEMQELLRKLIWTQQYEINLMNYMLKRLPENDMSNDDIEMIKNYRTTTSDFVEPNTLTISNTYCDPHFFDPEEHMKHIKNMKLTDDMYIEHMIPHHQVAVDMSKKLIKNTNNDFMIYLAYRIIHSQQDEIAYLNNLRNSNKYYATINIV